MLYPDVKEHRAHGTITVGSRTFALRTIEHSLGRIRIAEVIPPSDHPDAAQAAPTMVWLDRAGTVTLVTHLPVNLIDSPTVYMRAVDSPLAVRIPRSLVESTGIQVGTRLQITFSSR